MSYRRQALGSLEFDTRLRGEGAEYHNDWAISLAVKRLGWRVLYDPNVAVDHYEAPRRADAPRAGHRGRRPAKLRRVATWKAFNETYVAIRHLPLPRALAHMAFALVVGTSTAPGPLAVVVKGQQLGGFRAAAPDALVNLRARLEGAAAGVRARWTERP
jgi:hypothetical protein